MINNIKKKAFTLVELLIAMSLIAIVSVMLIPNVAQSGEKELLATQIKKVNGDLQQAVLLMMSQNLGTLTGFCSGDNANKCFIKELSRYLEHKVIFDETSTDLDLKGSPGKARADFCQRDVVYISGNNRQVAQVNTPFASHNCDLGIDAVHLKNGAMVSARFDPLCNTTGWDIDENFNTNRADYNLCGYIEVDVNAEKGPNTIGKDIHFFWIIDKDGLLPVGEVDNTTCANCTGANAECMGCTARVLRMGKIDYY